MSDIEPHLLFLLQTACSFVIISAILALATYF